jgi:hypothetical protein
LISTPWSLQILTLTRFGGLDVEIAQGKRGGDGREGGTIKNRVEVKQGFSPRSKPFILLKPGVSGLGPESPENPECSAPTPDTPLPLKPASRFSRNLILNGFGRLLM